MKTKTKTFSEIFSGESSYEVPPYQRKYSWDKSQLKVLLGDIKKILKTSNKKELFLGVLIFFKASRIKELKIVDGQQRMITLSLFIMVIIQKLNSVKDIKKRQKFEKELKKIIASDPNGTNLNLNFYPKEDQTIYWKIWNFIKNNEEIQNKSEWSKNSIWEIFQEAKNFFEFNLANKIPEIFELITKRTKFLLIFLNKKDSKKTSPLKIFETLNSTGKELKLSELVKNYTLFNLTSSKEIVMKEKLETYWNKWVELLKKNEKKKGALETFLDVLVHVVSEVEKSDLEGLSKIQRNYECFKNFFKGFELAETPKDIDPYLKFLEWFVVLYSLISNNEIQKKQQELTMWKTIKKSDSILEVTRNNRLPCFGWEYKILSLFFSLLWERDIIDYHIFKNLIEFTTIYELILRICKKRIGQLSVKYNSFVKNIKLEYGCAKINEDFIFQRPNGNNNLILKYIPKKEDSQEKILNYFKNCLREDIETEKILFQDLKNLKNNGKFRKKFIQSIDELLKKPEGLSLISASIVKLTTKTLNGIKNPTIEHIFPKKGINNVKIEKEQRESIGNMILLEEKINKKCKNKKLIEKVEIYKQSKNPEVKKLIEDIKKGQIQEWNEEQIEKRKQKKTEQFVDKIISSGFLEFIFGN